METLKIITLVLLCEVILYYLYTCYSKWSTGFYHPTTQIFNPLINWRDAHNSRQWQNGYKACQEKFEKEYRKAGLLKEGQFLS